MTIDEIKKLIKAGNVEEANAAMDKLEEENKQLFEAYIQQAESFEAKSKMQPINLNEILSDEDCEDCEDFYEKLIYLCRKGDVEAIEYYLYDHHFKSEDDAWIYIYLAQMCGKDFTKSDLRAYNAYTGEEYDDYGPIEVAGREAIQNVINLPELSDDQDNLVRKIATELFEKI